MKTVLWWLPILFLMACIEQRALEQFTATRDRLCVKASAELSVDQHLHTQRDGCVITTVTPQVAAGFEETGLHDGVYTTQATNVGFTQYRDEVIVARAGTTLAVMTPAAFAELARSAAAVHEARLEEQQLRDGLGLVIVGNLQVFGPVEAHPLPLASVSVLRQAL
jgi:hypothetical protein